MSPEANGKGSLIRTTGKTGLTRQPIFACFAGLALLCGGAGALLGQGSVGGASSTPAGNGGQAPTPGQVAQPALGVGSPASEPGQSATPSQTGQPKIISGPAVRALNTGPYASMLELRGLTVDRIEFTGVTFSPGETLPKELAQKVGEPLDPDKVRESTRRLFAGGQYRDIAVRGDRHGDSVTLYFSGVPRFFVGRVSINGVKSDRLASLLEFATKLDPGTPFSPSQVPTGQKGIEQTLEQNGFYEPKVQSTVTPHKDNRLIDATYDVAIGPQARVGDVTVLGDDAGLTEKEFRKKGKLKRKSRVTRDTVSNALDNLRAVYQKNDRLEGTITLTKSTYDPAKDSLNYEFTAAQGPKVAVLVEGIKVSKARLKLLVPVYEEGTVDNDLLNEGTYNLREFVEQQGYFDAKVSVRVIGAGTPQERILYTVDRGVKHRVVAVDLKGNTYFGDDLLKERLAVRTTSASNRSGKYSRSLVTGDAGSIEGLYRANGFSNVKVTPTVTDTDERDGKPLKFAEIRVLYTVDQGTQQKFGAIDLAGVTPALDPTVRGLMSSQTGQPFSYTSLTADRDAIQSFYLSQGYEQARVTVTQTPEPSANRTNVAINVVPGDEVFVDKVLMSGLNHTRPSVVQDQVLVHEKDPLNQTALLDTQRNLYNLAVFNEVVAAVENPAGRVPEKNILLQLTEAKRWDVTYGFGFEAQTGTPQRGMISEASRILLGDNSPTTSQDGKPGVSPRVSLDVSRINLRGTQESLTLHTTYGLLEEVAALTFNNPNLLGRPTLTFSATGGYSNVQNITTFAASTLQADVRLTQKVKLADTFIYDFQYRRVKVDPNSLQVSANLIPLLSQPVRVGGPQITWYHDRRSPSQLDATRGSYTQIAEFYASSKLGSQVGFNRVDGSFATYYQFGTRRKFVFARNTRLGYEQSFGANPNLGNPECAGVLLTTNASCTAVPLPERLYAGGATSLRGFSINGAGPRDLQTGYPVGGTAVIVNQLELRLPPPTLPYVGTSVNFVLFHDMGNVFQQASQMFPSFLRFHQPDQQTCRDVSSAAVVASHTGTCNFNYYSHNVGVGARYNTPVGPVRVDLSYSLNPPVYPVLYDFANNPPHVGQASHFNFFFSIGQSF